MVRLCSLCRTAFPVEPDKENEIAIRGRNPDNGKSGYGRTYTVCPRCLEKIDNVIEEVIEEYWRTPKNEV